MKFFIAAALLFASLHGMAAADDAAKIKDLLDKVIEANGGEQALGKIVALELKGKTTYFNDNEKVVSKVDMYFEGDDKMRLVTKDGDATTPDIEVVNGNKGWIKEAGKDTEELPDEVLAADRETAYTSWALNFVPLKEKDYRLSLLDEVDVNGRKAVGLLVKHEKHEPLRLFFDKESHLLVKYQTSSKDPSTGNTVADEVVYSDYVTVKGTKQPRKMEDYTDGVKTSETEGDTKLFDKPLDEKLFVKP